MSKTKDNTIESHAHRELADDNRRLRAQRDGMLLVHAEAMDALCVALDLPLKSSLETILSSIRELRR